MKTMLAAPWILVCFALLPCMAFAETSPAPKAEAGIEGVITVSPVRGGPTRQGEPSSKPLPSAAFVVMQGEKEVASFETDAQGHFRVALPPGKYEVLARNRKFGKWGPFPVEVTTGKMSTVHWECDSGIR